MLRLEVIVLILVFSAIFVVVKFIMNLSCFLQCKRYLTEYTEHINSPDWRIEESHLQIVRLLKRAGIKDATVPLVEAVGYGYVRTVDPHVFDNIGLCREDVVQIVYAMFHQAIGVYRVRMWEAFNPLYWIETILYLPRELMAYVGVSPDNAIVRVIQVIYWIASIVSVALVLVDRIL